MDQQPPEIVREVLEYLDTTDYCNALQTSTTFHNAETEELRNRKVIRIVKDEDLRTMDRIIAKNPEGFNTKEMVDMISYHTGKYFPSSDFAYYMQIDDHTDFHEEIKKMAFPEKKYIKWVWKGFENVFNGHLGYRVNMISVLYNTKDNRGFPCTACLFRADFNNNCDIDYSITLNQIIFEESLWILPYKWCNIS